ncbi:MAG: lysophospholipid acyltransferase family protein [Pseudomonadota bacterium]
MGEVYTYRYPRRRAVRAVLRGTTRALLAALSRMEVRGLEHLPGEGPVILAPNHFTFVDPPVILAATPRMVEFVGGADRVNSPKWSRMIPKMWGFIPAYRGAFSRSTLRGALEILEQGGVMGIFPEGGNWAGLLRPARPGMAYLAATSGARVVPVSIEGAEHVLTGTRAPLKVTYHAPVSAPVITSRGRVRREALDAYGAEIMARIAEGLPDDLRGAHSACPDARAAAEAVSAYPFHTPEMRGI